MNKIYTLDAKNNIMLELIEDHLNLDSNVMFQEINRIFCAFIAFLKTKEIVYQDLKNCLVPSIKKSELLLVFDRSKIESNWYGNSVFEKIIPILEKETSHSILCGDYIGENDNQDILYNILQEKLEIINSFNYQYSNQFYMVYLNNVSETMLSKFNQELRKFDAYVGFANLTNRSHLKTYLSFILCPTVIKHKQYILNVAEDAHIDFDNANVNIPDENLYGYPFEKSGFQCISIPNDFYGLFLSYKIESEIIHGYENDVKYCLNCLTDKIIDIRDCKILIEDPKYEYIHRAKENQLKKAEILTLNKVQLEQLIKDKISSNYIYNMEFNGHIFKFNIMLEFFSNKYKHHVKIVVALEYKPSSKVLRLITMY